VETIKLSENITFKTFKTNFVNFFGVKKIHDIRFGNGMDAQFIIGVTDIIIENTRPIAWVTPLKPNKIFLNNKFWVKYFSLYGEEKMAEKLVSAFNHEDIHIVLNRRVSGMISTMFDGYVANSKLLAKDYSRGGIFTSEELFKCGDTRYTPRSFV